ncbi:FMN-dependent oxidoreductase, nitrilotriacetate monooxygenase family [Lampropedia hyalina DSM 16112]|jgi:FMN-dependent oxidoreductase (nitrilotriacetate monooxygenase family)|uniref:FMN-dependent oxidoreductase, nitrilotriacetate monooxygenase family n=1 Tax=Lampropedia hyalina DSM 16112 TaxID=1122156 RepID=A0A1M4SLK9_9BURK|nr:NtaA/DmoA family FMN-dependent monooxygenase [Lampropedia hyalina]SHE33100.1 FMN-dependent oxidoreductase, nitrilotriacetate monooxygenase family [Lampropedia hyalina DSM 16112]
MPAIPPRQLHLNANVFATGRHSTGWRQHTPPVWPSDIDHFIAIARAAEAATFDAIFFSDQPGLAPNASERPWTALDPVILQTALARETTHIGLVATASTTFEQPYSLARRFASLAHASGGRAAWNIVTTHHAGVAGNYGLSELPEHATRYARAEEFVALVKQLWASWESGAISADVASEKYLDLAKVHPVSHQGEFFAHEGRFPVPPAPGGRPMLFQAGDSSASRDLGARHADALFTVQRTLADGLDFRRDVNERARRFGRDPSDLLVLPGLLVVLGDTEQAAHHNKEALDAQLDIVSEHQKLARLFGVEPGQLPLDEPFPSKLNLLEDWKSPQTKGFAAGLLHEAQANGWTVRQAIARNPGGHRVVIGAPEQIADDIEQWFREGAADGFNLNFDLYPDHLVTFGEQVVPLLRQRGLFRSAYEGRTLHQHLGLASI